MWNDKAVVREVLFLPEDRLKLYTAQLQLVCIKVIDDIVESPDQCWALNKVAKYCKYGHRVARRIAVSSTELQHKFKTDYGFALSVVREYPYAIRSFDASIYKRLVYEYPPAYCFAPDDIRSDLILATYVFGKHPSAFKYAPDGIKNNINVCYSVIIGIE